VNAIGTFVETARKLVRPIVRLLPCLEKEAAAPILYYHNR